MNARELASHVSNRTGPVAPGRRRLLQAAWSMALAGLVAPPLARHARAQPRFPADPFALGVASGCPRPDGFVLWTRLAPEPLAGGGLGSSSYAVAWEVAADASFRSIVRKGTANAVPGEAHSLHVELNGLEPDRVYWYRFHAGDATSRTGRTRTAPAPGADVDRLRFAIASCQQYEQGYYAAYRHMAADDVDLVVFLGDYIYESSWGSRHVRSHDVGEPLTLEAYRNRYALYKSDPDLQRMHGAAPWLVTWDDHEVENDYANDRSQRLDPDFLVRRAAAYRAYYEHMPLPSSALPRGPAMQLYDRYQYGQLATFHVLDNRQYRSYQPCPRPDRGGSNTVQNCPERLDPTLTLLGTQQERWLHEGLDRSKARWNVIAQQTLMARAARPTASGGTAYWTDGWDGYPAARQRLLDHIATRKPSNPLVVSGDVHTNYVCDLRPDFDDPRSPVVASEFCGTSITSQSWAQSRIDAFRAINPHMRHANSEKRGYVLIELEAARATARLRALDNEKRPDSRITTQASFVVEDGRPGPKPA
jgi:alkaline phosphatase D